MSGKFHEQLKLRTRWLTAPIRKGPLKGKRWIVASGLNFIRGRYEIFKTEAFVNNIRTGDIVYDIGGHVGYYSVLCATLAGEGGRVYVFEPRPMNIAYIRRHLELNGVENVELIEAALSDQAGQAQFDISSGTGTGHLANDGGLSVRTMVLDEMIDGKRYPYPDFLKMDIEGGEIRALNGARRVVEQARPRMLLATHGEATHEFVLDYLDGFGYRYEVLNPDATKGDTEIIAWPD
ncbi:MAG: FkbM family methyltransferase [Xanthomonadales bacterium]|nr:FkbM family methyltransferase [Xanthomonadales bacterium]